jgi:hypothetical protein
MSNTSIFNIVVATICILLLVFGIGLQLGISEERKQHRKAQEEHYVLDTILEAEKQ